MGIRFSGTGLTETTSERAAAGRAIDGRPEHLGRRARLRSAPESNATEGEA